MSESVGGNVILGENCSNVHVVNELSIPVICLGLKDVIVATSPDGILVSDKITSAQLKKYVPNNRPMFETREWGEYRVLDYQTYDNGTQCLTKELIIESGKNISYQKHNYRKETWTVTKGKGQMVINGKIADIRAGDNIIINIGDKYSAKAIEELHIIEVQIGDELTEEDIERFEWNWDKH